VQVPHDSPRPCCRGGASTAATVVTALIVAVVLGGYALALGFSGIPVLAAAVGGMIAGVVLVRALVA
jgi:hypothetical protein